MSKLTLDLHTGIMIKSHKELIVWQKSIELVKDVFILTDKFPKSEIYGIISQMRRAAVSVPSNIAEGYARGSRNELRQFYLVAYGSALELETQTIISKELKFAKEEDFVKVELLLNEVCRMLSTITRTLRSRN